MVQPLPYLQETASQTAGPYVHIGLAPGAAGFDIYRRELGWEIAGPDVPGERIRHTDRFDDPNLPGQMQTTIALRKVSVGTELTVVQEGIPAAIPTEACYLGWQQSLTLLAQLVEAQVDE